MANKILHTTIMQKNTSGGKNIIYPKTVTKNIIDGNTTLDQTLNTLKSSNVSNKTTEFTEATTRENLVSGETIATSHGKIMKLISDLKSLAYIDTVGVSNLDSTLLTAYNNRVTKDMVTTSTSITSAGYVADARAVNNLQTQINAVNSNIDTHLQRDGTFYVAGCPDFVFLELQKELLRLRLQIEHHGEVRLWKSEDGGVSFPSYTTLVTKNTVNDIFNTYISEVTDIDTIEVGGVYAVNVSTQGTLPCVGYGLLFVKRIYEWIYQDLYYTFENGMHHYHRKKINDGVWTKWFQYISTSDLEPQKINSINIDNEYLSVTLNWCVHLNVCYVTLSAFTSKQTADPVMIYNGLPKAHMASHIDFFNKATGNWFGSGWLNENTNILYCRLLKVDSLGWVHFSYPVRSV